METNLSLIVTIVNKGWGDKVLEASMKAGAEGGTIMLGRGMGIHEHQKILGICVEPEKEIILTGVSHGKKETVLQSIVQTAELGQPGRGVSFIIPIERIEGAVHLCTQEEKDAGTCEGKHHF
ncbi:P-II family nitrogen regulator [Chloroflexota bacterium]